MILFPGYLDESGTLVTSICLKTDIKHGIKVQPMKVKNIIFYALNWRETVISSVRNLL